MHRSMKFLRVICSVAPSLFDCLVVCINDDKNLLGIYDIPFLSVGLRFTVIYYVGLPVDAPCRVISQGKRELRRR